MSVVGDFFIFFNLKYRFVNIFFDGIEILKNLISLLIKNVDDYDQR